MRQPQNKPIKMKIDFVGESAGRDGMEGDLFRKNKKPQCARRVSCLLTAERASPGSRACLEHDQSRSSCIVPVLPPAVSSTDATPGRSCCDVRHLALLWCYSSGTLALLLCYYGVTLALLLCHYGITLVLL